MLFYEMVSLFGFALPFGGSARGGTSSSGFSQILSTFGLGSSETSYGGYRRGGSHSGCWGTGDGYSYRGQYSDEAYQQNHGGCWGTGEGYSRGRWSARSDDNFSLFDTGMESRFPQFPQRLEYSGGGIQDGFFMRPSLLGYQTSLRSGYYPGEFSTGGNIIDGTMIEQAAYRDAIYRNREFQGGIPGVSSGGAFDVFSHGLGQSRSSGMDMGTIISLLR